MGGTVPVPVPATKCGATALSMEFVSKPQEAYRLTAAIPVAIEGALGHLAGFAGCVLLISDKESRLVTVVTFWEGENRAALCSKAVAWVRNVVAPFLDHCLQVRSYDAYLPRKTLASRETTPEHGAQAESYSICIA
jgi:hypothetical protein